MSPTRHRTSFTKCALHDLQSHQRAHRWRRIALCAADPRDCRRASHRERGCGQARLTIQDLRRVPPAICGRSLRALGADHGRSKMKAYFYPDLVKAELLRQGCTARPSAHSRGSAVDLTLLCMKTGCECWHFTLTDEPCPDAAFTFPIRPR